MRVAMGLILVLLSHPWAEASVMQSRAERYGPAVDYEVYRNDESVGQYRLQFSPSELQLSVEVEMQISTKIFGLFSYDYLYRAVEVWRDDQLESLEVSMVTNGDEESVRAQRIEKQLLVVDPKGKERTMPAALLPTHHWYDDILQQQRVLNTLTGTVSEIAVVEETQAVWQINGVDIPVTGFRLGGDLNNTLSWYDQQGIWRGMRFKAKDGSLIDVRWSGARL